MSTPGLAVGTVVILIIYCISLAVYRLYLHPLARIPGPKIAALTVWYEFYHDGIKRGQYTFKIQQMHERYGQLCLAHIFEGRRLSVTGPLVRISPNELHCNDPSFIDTLYAGSLVKRDKYEYFASQFGYVGAKLARYT